MKKPLLNILIKWGAERGIWRQVQTLNAKEHVRTLKNGFYNKGKQTIQSDLLEK